MFSFFYSSCFSVAVRAIHYYSSIALCQTRLALLPSFPHNPCITNDFSSLCSLSFLRLTILLTSPLVFPLTLLYFHSLNFCFSKPRKRPCLARRNSVSIACTLACLACSRTFFYDYLSANEKSLCEALSCFICQFTVLSFRLLTVSWYSLALSSPFNISCSREIQTVLLLYFSWQSLAIQSLLMDRYCGLYRNILLDRFSRFSSSTNVVKEIL